MFLSPYEPEGISQIAARLREVAGLPKQPTGVVANNGDGVIESVQSATS